MLIVWLFQVLKKDSFEIRLRDCSYLSFKQVSKISDKNLPREKSKDLNNLVENKDLIIQKVDKSNTIVIRNKNDYISSLTRIPADTSKFKRLPAKESKVSKSYFW